MITMVTANSQTLTERQKALIEREQSYACIDSAERDVLQPRVKGLAACACRSEALARSTERLLVPAPDVS